MKIKQIFKIHHNLIISIIDIIQILNIFINSILVAIVIIGLRNIINKEK